MVLNLATHRRLLCPAVGVLDRQPFDSWYARAHGIWCHTGGICRTAVCRASLLLPALSAWCWDCRAWLGSTGGPAMHGRGCACLLAAYTRRLLHSSRSPCCGHRPPCCGVRLCRLPGSRVAAFLPRYVHFLFASSLLRLPSQRLCLVCVSFHTQQALRGTIRSPAPSMTCAVLVLKDSSGLTSYTLSTHAVPLLP